MSLVFDALRQQGTQPTQTPTALGSVVTQGRTPWLPWLCAAGLLCLAISAAVYLKDDYLAGSIAEPVVSAEPAVSNVAEVITVAVQPQEVSIVAPQPQPAALSVSRLPEDALVRLARPAPVTAVVSAELSEPLVETIVPAVSAPSAATQLPAPQGNAAPSNVILAAPEEKPVTVEVSVSAVADPASLFAAFNAALAAGQLPQANTIIDEARLALGDSHLMVARMEGYYCMIAQCPQQARQAYSTILSRLPQDREAGYNLAVLDWQSGHQVEARKRVRTLLAQHPGDEELRALQRLMGAHR